MSPLQQSVKLLAAGEAMEAHPAAQPELDRAALEPVAQPRKIRSDPLQPHAWIAILEQRHGLKHLVNALVFGQARDAKHQARLYLFLHRPEAIDVGSVLNDVDVLRRHDFSEPFAIVLAHANHRSYPAQRRAGDGLEVHLLEAARPLGVEEPAVRTYHQRDAVQQAQQPEILPKE